jgi:signal transduction histidine kinase
MFANVRWRIALWFVALSTLFYILPTLLSCFLFYFSLTSALDRELRVIASSFGHAIELDGDKPKFRDWARIVQTDPNRALVTIQLFDKSEHLIEHYGRPGIPILATNKSELHWHDLTMRTCTSPLTKDGKVLGFLQIQLPVEHRDDAVKRFVFVMLSVAPVVLLGLAWSSYLVSEKATRSILQNNALLRQFLADAGHELNTPLSIIQAATESEEKKLARQGIETPGLSTVMHTTERMAKIIEDLMLLSSMEEHKGEETQNIDVAVLMNDLVAEFDAKFVQKGVKLDSQPASGLTVCGDTGALERMLANLIENALKYTNEGGSVVLRASQDGAYVRFTVEDTGPGIPEDSLEKIFDRFYRVDNSRSRSSGGIGLGLAIAKAIALAHGGNIDVRSTLGKGSVFSVTIPTP